jgi:hypothetical protein
VACAHATLNSSEPADGATSLSFKRSASATISDTVTLVLMVAGASSVALTVAEEMMPGEKVITFEGARYRFAFSCEPGHRRWMVCETWPQFLMRTYHNTKKSA